MGEKAYLAKIRFRLSLELLSYYLHHLDLISTTNSTFQIKIFKYEKYSEFGPRLHYLAQIISFTLGVVLLEKGNFITVV